MFDTTKGLLFSLCVLKYLALPLVHIRLLAALNATDCTNVGNNLIIFLVSPPITRKNNYHDAVMYKMGYI